MIAGVFAISMGVGLIICGSYIIRNYDECQDCIEMDIL